MAMIPENPVVGGTVLRRAAIRSPNFVTTVSGWTINQDGSAEFNNITIRNGQVISGTQLYYSSLPPVSGNLIASISTVSGTDSAGNAYLPGITNYKKITAADFQAFQTNSGGFNLWVATAAGGPWNLVFSTGLQPDEVGYSFASNVNSAQVVIGETAAALEITPSNAALLVTSGLSTFQGQVTIERATGALGGILSVINDQSNPANAGIHFQGQASGDRVVRYDIVADTNARYTVNVDGKHQWGPGNAGVDSALYRAAANQLAQEYTAYDNGGVAETWSTPTFANSWSNGSSSLGPPLQFRRVSSPYKCVQVVGTLLVPNGFGPAGQAITTAIPTAFRPATNQSFMAVDVSNLGNNRIQLGTGGVFTWQGGGTVALDTLVIPAGVLISLDA